MRDFIVYISLAAAGCYLSAKHINNERIFKITGKTQTSAVIILLLALGCRMGSNEEVLANLGDIGLYAVIITVFTILGTVICASSARRVLGYNRYGYMVEESAGELQAEHTEQCSEPETEQGKSNSMTGIILSTVIAGIVSGYLATKSGLVSYELISNVSGNTIRFGLCIMLFLVGIDIGHEKSIIQEIRKSGPRVLIFPLMTIIGTFAGCVAASMLVPMTLLESVTVGAGLAWYSFAPIAIMDSGLIALGAISFMHNILRELFSVLLVPIIASKIGYIEAASVPASGAMDVCLPIVIRSTRPGMLIYSCTVGVISSVVVPVIIPVLVGMII